MDLDTVNSIIYDLEVNSKGPVQGSEEWLNLRIPSGGSIRGRIGGSDMASLIGLNPYKSFNKMMQEKLGLIQKTFPQKLFCWFGLLMEEVAVKIFEKNYNTKVMCKDISLIDIKLNQSIYSPDGICCLPINIKSGGIILRPCEKDDNVAPVLVEIKCPLVRPIMDDNNVPIHYMPQLQAGLLNIDITKAAIFIDNTFRFCSVESINNEGEFNSKLHAYDLKITEGIELEKGFIILSGDLPDNIETKWLIEIEIKGKKIYDFGGGSYTSMLNLLTNIRKNIYTINYINPNETDLDNIIDRYENVFGVIGWKQFDTNISLVYRDQFMIDKIVEKMENYEKGEYDNVKPPVQRKKRVRAKPPLDESENSDSPQAHPSSP